MMITISVYEVSAQWQEFDFVILSDEIQIR